MKIKFLFYPAFHFAIIILSGCSTSGTSIPLGSGESFEATDPSKIEILINQPSKEHSAIALVEGVAATDDYFTKARTQAAALEAIKKEAARLGAHAIVLNSKESSPYGQSTIANTTTSAPGFATTTAFGIGFEKITLSGIAIRYRE